MSNLKMPTPVGYLAWRDGKPCWDEDCVAEDAVYPLDETDDRESKAIYTADALRDVLEQAAQLCDAQDGTHEHIYSAAVRALIKDIQ